MLRTRPATHATPHCTCCPCRGRRAQGAPIRAVWVRAGAQQQAHNFQVAACVRGRECRWGQYVWGTGCRSTVLPRTASPCPAYLSDRTAVRMGAWCAAPAWPGCMKWQAPRLSHKLRAQAWGGA